MLIKIIIPCLNFYNGNGKVIKGIKFRNYKIIDDIILLVKRYM